VQFWRISSDRPDAYGADDLTGEGARRAGARWNSKGVPAVYASYHLATAVLETLVHVGRSAQPRNRYVVAVDVQDTLLRDRHAFAEIVLDDLPEGWNEYPPNPISQAFGTDRFRLGLMGFAIPSAILPEELNAVFNPLHPDFKSSVRAEVTRSFVFDPRL